MQGSLKRHDTFMKSIVHEREKDHNVQKMAQLGVVTKISNWVKIFLVVCNFCLKTEEPWLDLLGSLKINYNNIALNLNKNSFILMFLQPNQPVWSVTFVSSHYLKGAC